MACDPNNCTACKRMGLPILLTRPSLYDNRRAPDAVQRLPNSLGKEVSTHAWGDAVRPVLRHLSGGWVYVFIEKYAAIASKRWLKFAATTDGFIISMTSAEYAATEGKEAQTAYACSNSAQNFGPRYLVVPDAEHIGKVWLAFSSQKWTAATFDQYATNASLREERMQMANISAWVESGTLPAMREALTTGLLEQHVAEYRPRALSPKLQSAFGYSGDEFDLVKLGQAAAVVDAANTVAKTHPKLQNKTLLMMLRDPLGLAHLITHNLARQPSPA